MKYELTGETMVVDGVTLHRIRALKDFGDVSRGELGGWVESAGNLSQEGNCWVSENACVYGVACVSGNACVYDNASVSGNASVYGWAMVAENACVSGNAMVAENACVSGYALVSGNTRVSGNANNMRVTTDIGDSTSEERSPVVNQEATITLPVTINNPKVIKPQKTVADLQSIIREAITTHDIYELLEKH